MNPVASSSLGLVSEIEVETKSGAFRFQTGSDESILYAGLRHGLTLPYACATGTCGTCRARVMSGSVEEAWKDAPGAAKIKRAKGDILMCQTRALSDCVLRVPALVQATPERHEIPSHRSGRIGNVRRLTADVISFEVTLSEPMTFDAGQFVVLTAPGVVGARAYSMVSFERSALRIELVVKRKPDGGFSDWLFGAEPECQQVHVFGPLGRATFHPDEDKNLLMLAGGSGIAGMMSILARAGAERYFDDHKGYVFFGVRTLDDGFYLENLARYVAAAGPNLEVTLAISGQSVADIHHPSHANVYLMSGMVHEVAAQAMAGRYGNLMAFVAGPPPMVDGALRTLITQGGVSPQAIRYDKYS